MYLNAELILELKVQCTTDLEVGKGLEGNLRVIPIIGGTFKGQISGKVVSGGADWNTALSERYSHVFAKYLLYTEDGEYIAIENEGVIDNFNQDTTIKTVPKFTTKQNGAYGWLNVGVYVGSLEGGSEPGCVLIKIYRML